MSLPKPFGENTDYKITGHIIGISEFKVRHGPNEGRMMANILVRNKSGGANIVIWASQWERIKPHIKKFIPIEWAVRKGDSPGEYSLNSKGE
jgi:DNA polymerase III alpha subunit